MEKEYNVTVTFIFRGNVTVKSENPGEAREMVENDFGCVIGDLHTTLGDDEINWDFDVHPEKKIGKIVRGSYGF